MFLSRNRDLLPSKANFGEGIQNLVAIRKKLPPKLCHYKVHVCTYICWKPNPKTTSSIYISIKELHFKSARVITSLFSQQGATNKKCWQTMAQVWSIKALYTAWVDREKTRLAIDLFVYDHINPTSFMKLIFISLDSAII